MLTPRGFNGVASRGLPRLVSSSASMPHSDFTLDSPSEEFTLSQNGVAVADGSDFTLSQTLTPRDAQPLQANHKQSDRSPPPDPESG